MAAGRVARDFCQIFQFANQKMNAEEHSGERVSDCWKLVFVSLSVSSLIFHMPIWKYELHRLLYSSRVMPIFFAGLRA